MKKPKRSFLWVIISTFLLSAAGLMAQPELKNVQKGGKDKRAWIVLEYTENTRINGVSHPDRNSLCVYLYGSAGKYKGQSIKIHGGRYLSVKQVSEKPPYTKITLNFEDSGSVVVVERQNNVILSFGDNRLLQEAMNLPVKLPKGHSDAYLKDVARDSVNNQEKLVLGFNGKYFWNGFILNKDRSFSILISGASIFTASDFFTYPEGNVSNVSLIPGPDGNKSFRADVKLKNDMPFAATASNGNIIITTRLGKNTAYSSNSKSEQADASSSLQFGEESESSPVPSDLIKAEAVPVSVPTANNINETTGFPNQKNAADSIYDRKKNLTSAKRSKVQDSIIPWNSIVSFKFNETPIKDALRTVARANGINMVIGEGIKGNVTMDLTNVTLRQALNKIVHTHDCDYLVDRGIITIKSTNVAYSGGRITKIYNLRYADANNILPIVKQMVSADSLVHVFHREFLFFDEAGKNRMKKNPFAVQGIRRSSMFVVTDRPEVIQQIDNVIAQLDKEPTQFVIRAKLIEAAPNTNEKLGINWDKTLTTALQWQELLPGGDTQNYSALKTDVNSNEPWKMGHLSASQYKAVLDFLREKTDSKIISNPSVIAMDNEESVMSAGQTVPVPKIQRGMGGQGDMVTFDYKEVNIQLNVTPHLSENQLISMYVNPVIEEITGWVEMGQNRAPITSKRTVNSIVSVRNGETVVIGGLIKNQKERTVSKVWLLGSIPLIGNLFRHEIYTDKRTELLIFITPEIVRTRKL
ncbi:hypothetical protein J7K93_09885 [bacterium]|nr:hypothetical protein [bacterium]